MSCTRQLSALVALAIGTAVTVAFAADAHRDVTNNSYYLYTGALKPNEAGVVAVPSRFKWSVETSWRGIDLQGQELPDTRVMLRLYDPNHNFTAITAQMDLSTAEQLQRELAEIIKKKRASPGFQYRPQLYDPSMIPTGRIIGVNEDNEAIIDLDYNKAK